MLKEILGKTPCHCGNCRPVGTVRVAVTSDLAEAVSAELKGRQALILGDGNTLDACGTVLGKRLQADGTEAFLHRLGEPDQELHADQEIVHQIRNFLEPRHGSGVPVAVGAGTVNDLVKAASHDLGIRYIAVPTAASMNGFTSAIAAITVDGLKRTLPSTPPIAVLADPHVLAGSPRRMSLSGLGDLLSKPVSSADWRLSNILWNEPYCPSPAGLAEEAVADAVDVSSGLPCGKVEAVLALFEALLLSGISMAVAGSSSPASGGEHLVSHFLDMTAEYEPEGSRKPALHGEQVGVATGTMTDLYRHLNSLGTDEIDWETAAIQAPGPDDVRMILDRHRFLPKHLKTLFLRESEAKLYSIGESRTRVETIREKWESVRKHLAASVTEANVFSGVLSSVGAPFRPADIAVSEPTYVRACLLARWVRNRYTILDLADDIGLLGRWLREQFPGSAATGQGR